MATTLADISCVLEEYTDRGDSFLPALNQVLSRMHQLGIYKELTLQYSMPVYNDRIVLPEDAASILFARQNNLPVSPSSLWHDYRHLGQQASDYTALIDDGFSPVINALPDGGLTTLELVPSALSPLASGAPAAGSEIIVVADDGTKIYKAVFTGDGVSTTITFDDLVTNIRSIQFKSLDERFDLLTDALDNTTGIATVGSGEGVVRYRRYRTTAGTSNGTYVHALCRRKFIPLVEEYDITYIDNIPAIKHGLMAKVFEDNADIERASAFWSLCATCLEEESDASTGSATPTLNVDPYGTNMKDPIESMI